MIKSNLLIATSSQNYLNQALDELRNIDKTLKALENLGNGIMVLESSIDNKEFNAIVVKNKPIFIRHINTVDYVFDINKDFELNNIVDIFNSYEYKSLTGQKVAIQIRKANTNLSFNVLELKNSIDEHLKEKYDIIPEIKEPEKVISIFISNDKCFIGISDVSSNISSWSGGMVHYKKDDNDVSRAKFKLMEAIYLFNLNMDCIHNAIDLGAAPGGWTSVLLEHGIVVTAIDTGDMDERLLANKNLTFIKNNVSDITLETEVYDMLTSDISWNPINTAKMILNCSYALKKDGLAIVTVKLMNSKIGKTIKDVKKIYSEVYDIVETKQLFHNRDEVTIYMKKI